MKLILFFNFSTWSAAFGLEDGMYFFDNRIEAALFYNFDGTRDSPRDIGLGTFSWLSALGLEDGMYFVRNDDNIAYFYNFDETADSDRNISLGTGSWRFATAVRR